MIDFILANYLGTCERASRTFTDIMWNQWRWLIEQYRFGVNCWNPLWVGSAPARKDEAAAPPGTTAEGSLEARARERLSKGLAPPREIYDVRNRDRLDWSRVPEWARPVDPEAFEGCGHEG